MPNESSDKQAASQGTAFDAHDPDELRRALDLAFEYRGDVTIARKSTGESIEGYIYDRTCGATLAVSTVRIIATHGDQRITIPYDDIAQIRFTGKDTAAGKSFETWMKNYVQKKRTGEAANIESESLDEP